MELKLKEARKTAAAIRIHRHRHRHDRTSDDPLIWSDSAIIILDARITELEAQRDRLPKIVCLCGSTRFMKVFRQANLTETLAGKIVLSIGCNTKSDDALGLSTKEIERLKELHLRKIDLADEVYVLNVGGYIGSSTRKEIEYAESLNVPVKYLKEIKQPVVDG